MRHRQRRQSDENDLNNLGRKSGFRQTLPAPVAQRKSADYRPCSNP